MYNHLLEAVIEVPFQYEQQVTEQMIRESLTDKLLDVISVSCKGEIRDSIKVKHQTDIIGLRDLYKAQIKITIEEFK